MILEIFVQFAVKNYIKMLYEENRLAFKNITEAVIDKKAEKLIPICPHCGHNTQNE